MIELVVDQLFVDEYLIHDDQSGTCTRERREGVGVVHDVPVNNLTWWALLFLIWQVKNRELLEMASFQFGKLL